MRIPEIFLGSREPAPSKKIPFKKTTTFPGKNIKPAQSEKLSNKVSVQSATSSKTFATFQKILYPDLFVDSQARNIGFTHFVVPIRPGNRKSLNKKVTKTVVGQKKDQVTSVKVPWKKAGKNIETETGAKNSRTYRILLGYNKDLKFQRSSLELERFSPSVQKRIKSHNKEIRRALTLVFVHKIDQAKRLTPAKMVQAFYQIGKELKMVRSFECFTKKNRWQNMERKLLSKIAQTVAIKCRKIPARTFLKLLPFLIDKKTGKLRYPFFPKFGTYVLPLSPVIPWKHLVRQSQKLLHRLIEKRIGKARKVGRSGRGRSISKKYILHGKKVASLIELSNALHFFLNNYFRSRVIIKFKFM